MRIGEREEVGGSNTCRLLEIPPSTATTRKEAKYGVRCFIGPAMVLLLLRVTHLQGHVARVDHDVALDGVDGRLRAVVRRQHQGHVTPRTPQRRIHLLPHHIEKMSHQTAHHDKNIPIMRTCGGVAKASKASSSVALFCADHEYRMSTASTPKVPFTTSNRAVSPLARS